MPRHEEERALFRRSISNSYPPSMEVQEIIKQVTAPKPVYSSAEVQIRLISWILSESCLNVYTKTTADYVTFSVLNYQKTNLQTFCSALRVFLSDNVQQTTSTKLCVFGLFFVFAFLGSLYFFMQNIFERPCPFRRLGGNQSSSSSAKELVLPRSAPGKVCARSGPGYLSNGLSSGLARTGPCIFTWDFWRGVCLKRFFFGWVLLR